MENLPNLEDTEAVKCAECNSETFIQAFLLKKISKIVALTEQDVIIPFQVFRCCNCGHVNEEFLPNNEPRI